MPSLITNDWCQLFSAFSVSAPLYQIWYVLRFISVTGVYDEHLSQAGAVLNSCVLTRAQLHIFLTWVQHTVKWTMLNDPSEVNTWKWYSLSFRWLTVFSSRWRWFNSHHIVWHDCGCCDTRRHTRNMESLQTISMENANTRTFTGRTKYVIISVAG